MSSSNCCFLTCIQVSQETGQVVWYSHLLKNFPQFIVIHTVKGFGIVNKAEIDSPSEWSCKYVRSHDSSMVLITQNLPHSELKPKICNDQRPNVVWPLGRFLTSRLFSNLLALFSPIRSLTVSLMFLPQGLCTCHSTALALWPQTLFLWIVTQWSSSWLFGLYFTVTLSVRTCLLTSQNCNFLQKHTSNPFTLLKF